MTDPRAVVVEAVTNVEPMLTPAVISAVVDQVAPARAELRRLARALHLDPSLLTSGEPDGPRLLQTLIGALIEAGGCYVRPAPCARCHRFQPLRRRVEGRLACEPCARAAPAGEQSCARCHRICRIAGRDGSGAPLCSACNRRQRDANPLGQLADTVDRLGTGLSITVLQDLIATALPRPHQQRAASADLASGPSLLATNAAYGSHQLVLLAEALLSAGSAGVAAPSCAFCQRRVPIKFRRDGLRCCKRCYEAARTQPCTRCGRPKPVVNRTAEGAPLCKACDQREPANFEPCARCGRQALLAPTDSGDRCCRRCWRAPTAICSICGRHRPCYGAAGPSPRCETCTKRSNTAACGRCGNLRVVAVRTEQGTPLCQPCTMSREQCVSCQRIRPVIARPPGGPVCGTCWRRYPAAVRTCDRCGVITWLYHHGLCATCARPGLVRDVLTATDGRMHPSAQAVFDVLTADENPSAVLKWLQSATARALLTALASHAGPLDHHLLDQLRPAKAAARLRALLVARGALLPRDEYLASLERWINTTTAAIVDLDDRRLVRRFAIWHHLRRLRSLSSSGRPVGYGQSTVVRSELSATVALLSWLRKRDTTLRNTRQPDIDDWLANGPTTRHGASAFVTWAVQRGHATNIDLPARTGATHRRVLPHQDQRWGLVRALLHDENLHTVDRVAGLLVLLYAQPVSRAATLTVDHVQTDGGSTHLLLGSSPIRLPPPLDRLVNDLVNRRAGHTAVGRTALNQWLFPGAAPGRPLSPPRLSARLRRLGIPTRLARNTTLIDLAAQIPAAVLSQLLGLHLQTATSWTVEAGNTRMRYAATIADSTRPDELKQKTTAPD